MNKLFESVKTVTTVPNVPDGAIIWRTMLKNKLGWTITIGCT